MQKDDNILIDIIIWNMFIKLFVTVVGSCDGTCTVKDSTTAEATCRLTYGTVTHLCSCPPGFHLTEANPDECVGMCVALLYIGYGSITSIVRTWTNLLVFSWVGGGRGNPPPSPTHENTNRLV